MHGSARPGLPGRLEGDNTVPTATVQVFGERALAGEIDAHSRRVSFAGADAASSTSADLQVPRRPIEVFCVDPKEADLPGPRRTVQAFSRSRQQAHRLGWVDPACRPRLLEQSGGGSYSIFTMIVG